MNDYLLGGTVDGSEIRRSSVDMVNITLFTGFHTCQVVQAFFHQQYEPIRISCFMSAKGFVAVAQRSYILQVTLEWIQPWTYTLENYHFEPQNGGGWKIIFPFNCVRSRFKMLIFWGVRDTSKLLSPQASLNVAVVASHVASTAGGMETDLSPTRPH